VQPATEGSTAQRIRTFVRATRRMASPMLNLFLWPCMALMRLMNAAGMPYSEAAPGDLDGGAGNSLVKRSVTLGGSHFVPPFGASPRATDGERINANVGERPIKIEPDSAEEREIIAICQKGQSEPLTEAWIEHCLKQARAIGVLY
jgi:hypothetical protein